MRLGRLKAVRVAVSLLFLVATGVVFLDFTGAIPPAATGWVLYLQFLPSFLRLTNVASLAASGCLVIILVTLLFGRVYCSSVCPVGTLQDLIAYVARRRHRRRYYRFRKPGNLLPYGVLIAAPGVALAGSMVLLTLLDPFSIFGRIVSSLLRPALVVVNNGAAFVTDRFQWYGMSRMPVPALGAAAVISVLTLALIAWLASTRGRLYCNSLCPVGALLGLLARRSLFRIAIAEDACNSCSLCERVCKAECIDRDAKRIDVSRCVGCFNCFTACRQDALTFRRIGKSRAPSADRIDVSRRLFVHRSWMSLVFWAGATQAGKTIVPAKDSTVPAARTQAVSPPGSLSVPHFTSTCTACHLCITACPTRVLAPSFLEYGVSGIFQPTMTYLDGYCNFDCTLCADVCPSGAILSITPETKKTVQIGVSKFVKDNCIVYTENTECGACSEHCPTKAVTMVPYKQIHAPEVKEEYCVGCGACEHACPTRPYKAIYVEGNAVHTLAKKVEVKPVEQPAAPGADFPF